MDKLALFFTYGMTLKEWYEKGYLQREIDIYSKLKFKKIYFVTYGTEDKKYQKYLPKNFEVLQKKWKIPNLIYSFVIPLTYNFKGCVLKTNQILGSWSAVLTKMRYKTPLVVRTGYTQSRFSKDQSLIKRKLVELIEMFGFKNANHIIITTKFDKEYLIKKYGINNISIIQNSINTDLFKKYNTKKERDIIVIGRFEKQKNMPALLKALKNLNLKTTIIGSGSMKPQMQTYAKNNNIKILFKEKIDNQKIPQELAKHKIFVQASLYEGNPKTLLEAMSCQMPCIGTDVEGIREVITHKKNGILCKTDSQSIKEAIIHLISSKDLQKIGKEARKTIINNNSLKCNIKKEMKIYENL